MPSILRLSKLGRPGRILTVIAALGTVASGLPALGQPTPSEDLERRVREVIWPSAGTCQLDPQCIEDIENKRSSLPSEAVPIIIKILEEEGNTSAVFVLGYIQSEESYEALSSIIRRHSPGTGEAFAALRRHEDPRVLDFLAAYIHDPSPGIRRYAVAALGGHADPRAVRLLKEVAKEEPDREIRENAKRIAKELEEKLK